MPPSIAGAGVLSGRRIVVTGATGFIGRRMIARLVSEGALVTAFLRSRHGADALSVQGVTVARADLRDPSGLVPQLVGADCVIHLAYDVRASGRENLAAFDGLLAAVRQAGVPRVVHTSSVVVYDSWPDARLTEASPWGGPGGGEYRAAKIDMERRLLGAPFEAAILQPTLVYGSGSAIWTEAPLAALAAGGVVLPDPTGLAALVHADDVAHALCLAATVPGLGRDRFLVSGPASVAWADYLGGLASMSGKGEVRMVPRAEIEARLGPESAYRAGGPTAAARLSAALRTMLGKERFESLVKAARGLRAPSGPVWPDRFMLDLYSARPEIDCAHAKRKLGYSPLVGLAEGLAEIGRQSN